MMTRYWTHDNHMRNIWSSDTLQMTITWSYDNQQIINTWSLNYHQFATLCEHSKVPSSICYWCVLVKPPFWGKTRSRWSHASPLKRWQHESSLVQGVHCKWSGCKVGELGYHYQWRFSEVWLLNLFECLLSVYQCISTRVCGLWYGSPETAEDHLFPPDG